MASNVRYNVMHFDKQYTGYSDVFVAKYGKLYTDVFAHSVLQCFDQILETKEGHSDKLSFCIADFGTADGGMVLGTMNKLIDMVVRRYGQKADVTIIFEDHPSNDYKALFKKITGHGSNMNIMLRQSENVHVLVSATSMYQRCLKNYELDLCLSSIALHWLSKKPCNVENSVHSDCASDLERKMFSMQAEEDWKTFLNCRGKELNSNGCMVLLIPCAANVVHGGFHTFTKALKELLHSGKITDDEFSETTFMIYHRTEKEFRKPFSENDSSVTENRLKLLDFRVHDFTVVSGLDGVQCKDQKTIDTYAEAIITLVKPWAYNTFYCGLSEERQTEQKHDLVNEYFDILQKLIINSDSFPDSALRFAEVVIRKQ